MSAQITFNNLVKTLKAGPKPGDKQLKVAVLADFASQHLAKALKAAGLGEGLDLQIWEADYDAIDAAVMNDDSELYQDRFHYVILFFSSLKAYRQFSAKGSKSSFADRRLNELRQIVDQISSKSTARIIISNYAEYDDGVFGNFANKTPESFLFQMRRLNTGIMELAAAAERLFVTDLQALQMLAGRMATFDAKLYIHGDIIYSLDFIALAAVNTMRIAGAAEGRFRKCVIIDLDNTMWGGIIGDDGMEKIEVGDLGIGKAFTALQYWLRNLKERGIILAVCSKNTEHIAKEPFEQHPGMVLRLEDISVFVANWETKVDNIRFIQSVLNIGFDSMVFLDDNPFERNMVRQYIPEVTVPELPEDPALYLEYLQSLNLFETASYTAADADRTRQYREEASRAALQKSFSSEAEFLQSLNMEAIIRPVDKFSLPRVAQLTQRSNQFNLRTIRYSDAEIARMADSGDYRTITVNLSDTYGDYGLISAVILEKKGAGQSMFIDTWIMSCRVLKRGVEGLVLNEIVQLAKEAGAKHVTGAYIPTAKNGIVATHYERLGFTQTGEGLWKLDVDSYQPKKHFINITKHQNAF
jgi:FkbH-like protein